MPIKDKRLTAYQCSLMRYLLCQRPQRVKRLWATFAIYARVAFAECAWLAGSVCHPDLSCITGQAALVVRR
jgi:hypothetical protein